MHCKSYITALGRFEDEDMYAIKCKANECSRYMGICVLILDKSVHIVTSHSSLKITAKIKVHSFFFCLSKLPSGVKHLEIKTAFTVQ